MRDLLQVNPVDSLVLAIQSTGLNLAQSPGNLLDAVKNGGVQATNLAREQSIFRGSQAEVTCVAINPNGKSIASGSKDGTVQLWNTQGNPIGKPFHGHQGSVRAVTFSPDNQFIASCRLERRARGMDPRARCYL
ncbi:WD40 repeat domain-containing protein [Scytonema sp. NUACC26]|uniref:WD40 repeat domain-containing protein n=1 Tax=Scytonema sp. NUACC26 TaxID=3140176 RepID=UPI0038B34947